MKKITILFSAAFFIFLLNFTGNVSAQGTGSKLPNITVTDLNNVAISTADFSNDGKPIIICFWATWCGPCIEELEAIAEEYDKWVAETGVKLYAVAVDNTRTKNRVKPLVDTKEWSYDIILDENQDFQRGMNVNLPPHAFLLNGEGVVVWQHSGYTAGDEEELYEELKKISTSK